MMTLVAEFFARWNKGDIAGLAALFNEDADCDLPFAGRGSGREHIETALLHHLRRFKTTASDLRQFAAADGGAVEATLRGSYLVTETGLPEASGQNFSIRLGAFFDIAEGLIDRATIYIDETELRRAIST